MTDRYKAATLPVWALINSVVDAYIILYYDGGKKTYPYYNILLSEYTKNIMSNVIQEN